MPEENQYHFWTSDGPRRVVDDGQADELVEVDWKKLIERRKLLVHDHRVVVITRHLFDLFNENHKNVKRR